MRKDGTRVKNVDPFYMVAPYIMDKRYDAMNMVEEHVPVAGMTAYLNEKRRQGTPMSHLDIVLAAYLRTACEFPLLNRFVVNKRIYTRNEFPVSMVVLKPGETDGSFSKVKFEMTDTIFDVHRKFSEYVNENRKTGENNSTDKLVSTLLGIPGLVNIGVWLFKLLDKWGWLPKSIIDASPFHTSLVITNLGSIRTRQIYHHLYEFGTASMFIAMGMLEEVPMKKRDGMEFVRCLPMGIVMDERIASGAYFAQVFARCKQYMENPALLEEPPKVILKDE